MKSEIFKQAITRRNNLRFLYGLEEINLEPYYISKNKSGKKVIYGRLRNTNVIKKFEYERIANIRIVDSIRFSPRIPLNSFAV
jgi:hypothetical protein